MDVQYTSRPNGNILHRASYSGSSILSAYRVEVGVTMTLLPTESPMGLSQLSSAVPSPVRHNIPTLSLSLSSCASAHPRSVPHPTHLLLSLPKGQTNGGNAIERACSIAEKRVPVADDEFLASERRDSMNGRRPELGTHMSSVVSCPKGKSTHRSGCQCSKLRSWSSPPGAE